MRAFWIILSLLVVGGVAFSLSSLMSGPPAPLPPAERPSTQPPPESTPTPTSAPTPASAPAAGPEAAKAPEPPAAVESPKVTAPEQPVAADNPAPMPTTPADSAPPTQTAPAAPTAASSPGESPPTDTATAAAAPGESVGKIGAYDVMAGKVERKDDGTTVLDDRYTVKGEGTLEKPYEITWELLTSVDQDFDPHSGKKKIPQRIAFLHEKYVKLGGYIAFPMNMQQPRELLLMLNQWDGCCIGVPPTPYDAIEASLNKTVVGDDRFATVGGVVGKMGIKPYVVGDWLVGLYTMEFGDFKPSFGDDGGA